jgi:TIR domain
MADMGNVFISWSGQRSKLAAEAFREWLGTVLQNAKPWMSESDIEKGSRGLDEIARALEGMKVGIICLTPENLSAEWLLYEAGALSKTQDAKTRVCTYLLFGLEPTNLKPPLSLFQATKANKSDTRKLVGTINNHLDAAPLAESTLNSTFEKWWPDLEKALATLPAPSVAPPPYPETKEMVAEILEHVRRMVPNIQDIWGEAKTTRTIREMATAWREAVIGKAAKGAVITGEATIGAGGIGAALGAALENLAVPPPFSDLSTLTALPSGNPVELKMPPIPLNYPTDGSKK